MKAFTDIEQSKELVDILPLESADMFCAEVFNKEKETRSYNFHSLSTWGYNTFKELKVRENKFVHFIPAWSLAALLETLPLEVEIHKQTDGHKIYYYVESYMKRMNKEIYLSTERYENVVDACVEMIIKLHKEKLL